MILGNRSTGWNSNINTYGLDILWFNLFFSGFGFVCLCLCMAEMSSALPFSGGLFGFVRASVGPFFGFMVACTEFMFCMTQMSLKAQRFLSDDDGQLIVIVMFGFCLVVNLIGGRPVFALTSFMGFCIAIMMLIYLFGTLSKVETDEVSYSHFSPLPVEFTWFNVMSGRPSVGGQFSGIQYLTLLADLLRDPKEQLPRVWLVSLFIFMAMSVFVILAAVSQAPLAKSLQKASFPMQGGYARIFELQDLTQMKWVDFPFQFGSIFCLYYCAGKQLLALSRSGLLPSIFKKAQRFLSDVNGQLIVIVMFGFCLVVNLIGGRPVFALSSFMGFCIATMLLIYLFGTLSALGTADVSYSHFSPLPVEFTWFNVMSGRPSVGGQFNCLQYFSLVGDLLEKPKEQLPRVWVVSMFIFVVMTVFVILASVSQTPSAKSLQKATFPMQGGYARKQLLALSQSGLFPSIFKKLVPGSDAPFMGFCIVIMLLIYLFGTLSKVGTADVSYSHYSPLPVEFTWFNMMSGRPSVGGQFNCLQYYTLLGDLMKAPKEQLPRVWLVSLFIFMATSVFVILAAVSQTPSAKSLQKATFPMQGGYARIFELQDLTQMKWIDFPFQFGSIFCLFYCAGKQLLALAQSGLLPSIFKKVVPGSDSPYVCYTFTAIIAIGMNMFFLYDPTYLGEVKGVSTILSF
eukprot:gene8906-biopygen1675